MNEMMNEDEDRNLKIEEEVEVNDKQTTITTTKIKSKPFSIVYTQKKKTLIRQSDGSIREMDTSKSMKVIKPRKNFEKGERKQRTAEKEDQMATLLQQFQDSFPNDFNFSEESNEKKVTIYDTMMVLKALGLATKRDRSVYRWTNKLDPPDYGNVINVEKNKTDRLVNDIYKTIEMKQKVTIRSLADKLNVADKRIHEVVRVFVHIGFLTKLQKNEYQSEIYLFEESDRKREKETQNNFIELDSPGMSDPEFWKDNISDSDDDIRMKTEAGREEMNIELNK